MKRTRGVLSVCGTACIYFAMGLYFSSGNTAVYLTSYLRQKNEPDLQHSDSIWFLAVVGLSAVLLPFGGWLEGHLGVRVVCLLGGLLQSVGILATYLALETTFLLVVICYGGSFFLSCGISYTPSLATIVRWFPDKKGLVTGIVAAGMALAPTAWTPIITAFVNPLNVPPGKDGFFTDDLVLERTKQSLLVQGCATLALFLIGTAMMFPAPHSQEAQQEVADAKLGFDPKSEEGLPASQAVKTKEFFLLSMKLMITELVFFYLLFVYKPFGQTFIEDDYFLSGIGACAAVSNTASRLIVGHIKDLTTYKMCSLPLSGIAAFLVTTLPVTSRVHKIMYAAWVVLAVGITGSQYALMPSAVTEAFGEKHASINIGLVYMSTVIADLAGAFGSQHLTNAIGWTGMIGIMGGCALIDFAITFFLPDDPQNKLKKKMLALNFGVKAEPPVNLQDEGATSSGTVATEAAAKHGNFRFNMLFWRKNSQLALASASQSSKL